MIEKIGLEKCMFNFDSYKKFSFVDQCNIV